MKLELKIKLLVSAIQQTDRAIGLDKLELQILNHKSVEKLVSIPHHLDSILIRLITGKVLSLIFQDQDNIRMLLHRKHLNHVPKPLTNLVIRI
jgi:hypothetical protein